VFSREWSAILVVDDLACWSPLRRFFVVVVCFFGLWSRFFSFHAATRVTLLHLSRTDSRRTGFT
jgi:hypothetical protein